MAIPSSGELSMNLFNTDRGISSGTQIDLAAAGTAYAISYTTDGSNDLQMYEFYGKSSLYWTATRSGNFTRNNCSAGYVASTVTYSKTYTSYISQANANALASGDANFNSEGQTYANTYGTCTLTLNAAATYGCESNAPNKGYINVSSYSGGTGTGYGFRYKLESADDSTYSAWINGTGTTGGILANGNWMLQIRDSANNYMYKYNYVINCNYPSLTGTVTSGGSYNGNAYIRVTSISGGSGSGYYWYLNTDPTHRAVNDYALNLSNGEYIVFIADGAGNVSSFNPITFSYPEPPNYLSVRFKSVNDGSAPSGTNGGCDIGTNITVEMPSGATFENASSFINTIFGGYPSGNVGWLSYNGRYVPIGKYTSGNSVAPFGSRANCPVACTGYSAVSPAEYQCVGYTKQQKYHDGNCGYTWVDVETNSSYCGYSAPTYASIYLSSGYDAASACDGFGGYYTYYIPYGDSWSYATALYSDNSGTVASAGFYSDGTIVKEWDGVSDFYSTQMCGGGGGIA
jgi:hypothetical protein